ncbi:MULTISPECIES: alpha/beta fold hydrolase [Thalassobaculum]|uniref:Pimeloyl-ACP methyl ester carboxylesterase n=1 Tax=Thalassobaculum litoreum DSM 18839 TaxID=1123362 RepID=A0A8G2EX56_9PROT|nr:MULTISPECIES: alpha/beta hydrolase [Thalassobaculum]SDF08539.1 Pimeloyl-ACP methyl ester carboxylesterase [Thalassobaculum litoreum DSM 18839]
MPHLEIADGESLYFEHTAPSDPAGKTFVFVNALTGSYTMWEASIAPALREAGHGTLVYNFRGQAESRTAPTTKPTPTQIVDDLDRLCAEVRPARPVLVGLSIGGLFAAQAYARGLRADGIVLINTLRKPTERLEWINTAMAHGVAAGGFRLIMELNLPMLVNPDQLAKMRADVQTGAPYTPIDPADGGYRLMVESVATDWNFPWETLDIPAQIMVGLHDRVFYVADDVEELAARIPTTSRVVFPDAGHLIPIERPGAFTEALLDFAKTV